VHEDKNGKEIIGKAIEFARTFRVLWIEAESTELGSRRYGSALSSEGSMKGMTARM
jgi:hypothetical protein